MLLRWPGVYRAQGDTELLGDALDVELERRPPSGRRILELGTGSGALAVRAAGHRGARVVAVDVSRAALASAWTNAALRGRRVRVRHGDLVAPVVGGRFDVIVSNPPYVPAATERLPTRGRARAWDAGCDGRAVLDRLCAEAPALLAPGGALLVVQSAVCGVTRTCDRLAGDGLETAVVAESRQPFGPVLSARVELLEARGLIAAGQREEELVVIVARRGVGTPAPARGHSRDGTAAR